MKDRIWIYRIYEYNRRLAFKNNHETLCQKERVDYLLFLTIQALHAQSIPAQLDSLFHQVSTDPQIRFNGVVLVAEK